MGKLFGKDDKKDAKKEDNKQCHTGNVLVFETGNARYFAGGSSHQASVSDVDFVVDLAYNLSASRQNPVKYDGKNSRMKNFVKLAESFTQKAEGMKIDWPDGSTPDVGLGFYESLFDTLEGMAEDHAAETGNKLDILVCCVGGHGRTGTLMTIFGLIAGVIPKDAHAVEWMRQHYCENAVETNTQAMLIDKFAGCLVNFSAPVKSWGVTSGTYGGGYSGGSFFGKKTEPTIVDSDDDDDYKPWSY